MEVDDSVPHSIPGFLLASKGGLNTERGNTERRSEVKNVQRAVGWSAKQKQQYNSGAGLVEGPSGGIRNTTDEGGVQAK